MITATAQMALLRGRWQDFKLLAALVNPASQLNEVVQRQLLDGAINFFNFAHGRKIASAR